MLALKIVSIILIVLAIYFIYDVLIQHWDIARTGPAIVSYHYLISGICIMQLYYLYQVALWRWVLSSYGQKVNFFDGCTFYFSNNLLAYIPGKMANVIGIGLLAKKRGYSSQSAVTTVVLFQIYSLISGTMLVAASSFMTTKDAALPVDWFWLFGILSLLGLVLISPRLQRRTLVLIAAATKKELITSVPNFRTVIAQVGVYGLGWILQGFALWCIYQALLPEDDWLSFWLLLAVYVSSYIVGLLAVLVPSGLGVLEAGLVLGLGTVIGAGHALWGAAMLRLVAVGLTLCSTVIVFLIEKRTKLVD